MENFRRIDSGPSSGVSRLAHYEDNRCLNGESIQSLPKEWTDEKHSLYLKSMEASFVTELYSSMGMHDWRSQKTNHSDLKSSGKAQIKKRSPSCEFKILHCGCWQKINYGTVEPRLYTRGETRRLLANPWIQHFRSPQKPGRVSSLTCQKSSQSTRQVINLNEEPMPDEADSISKPFGVLHSHSCSQDMVGSYKEVSDQNFVDEEPASNEHSLKRMKTATRGFKR